MIRTAELPQKPFHVKIRTGTIGGSCCLILSPILVVVRCEGIIHYISDYFKEQSILTSLLSAFGCCNENLHKLVRFLCVDNVSKKHGRLRNVLRIGANILHDATSVHTKLR